MPSNLTWLLQPLDLSVHRPLKSGLHQIFASLSALMRNTVTKQNLVATVAPAIAAAFTKDNIQAGWRAAGLVDPFDKGTAVLQKDEVKAADARAAKRASARAASSSSAPA